MGLLLPGTVGGPAINTTEAGQFSPENIKPLTLEPQRWGDQEAQADNGGHADAGAVRGNVTTEQGGRHTSGEKQNPGQTEGGGSRNSTQGQKRHNRERERKTSTSRQIEQQVLGLASCLKPPKCAQNI